MKSRSLILPLFLVLAAVQIYAPISMILERETILEAGKSFRFRTAPVDPFDPFRGRYVRLNYEADTAKSATEEEWHYGETGFARIEVDSEGFASFSTVSRERPEEGDCLEVKVFGSANEDEVRVSIPFDRYYMKETDAPEAESAYREQTRGRESNAYAVIRILDGHGVLESLFVDDQPIEEFIKNPPETADPKPAPD